MHPTDALHRLIELFPVSVHAHSIDYWLLTVFPLAESPLVRIAQLGIEYVFQRKKVIRIGLLKRVPRTGKEGQAGPAITRIRHLLGLLQDDLIGDGSGGEFAFKEIETLLRPAYDIELAIPLMNGIVIPKRP